MPMSAKHSQSTKNAEELLVLHQELWTPMTSPALHLQMADDFGKQLVLNKEPVALDLDNRKPVGTGLGPNRRLPLDPADVFRNQ